MNPPPKKTALAVGLALSLGAASACAQISYTGGTYQQDFDTLANTGTGTTNAFTDNVTLPGWYAQALEMNYAGSGDLTLDMTGETRANADDYAAGDGSSTSGDLYSFGSPDSTERALGSLSSGTPDEVVYGFRVQNDTGSPLGRFTLTYDGEQWRRGGNATQRPESLLVYYRAGGTEFLVNDGWTAVPDLNFVSPNATDSVASALDGNAPENRISGITKEVILPTPLAPGDSLWILWVDPDNAGSDHALAIDNVVFSAEIALGSEVPRGAGTNFTPTSFGGNAFTADDTALFDGSATAVSLEGTVLAAGLKFVTNGYELTGGVSDTIHVDGVIDVATDAVAEITGVLTGDSGLTKTGAGTLILDATNTFTGPVSINGGTLRISSDTALGAPDNDLILAGTLSTPASTLSLGAGRSISGSGMIELQPGTGTLSLDGPVAGGSLTLSEVTTLNLAGATNSFGGLTFGAPVAINITGGTLQLSGGNLNFNQTSGSSTISGSFANSGDRGIFVGGGTVQATGTVALGGRIIKTGPGTLDFSAATVAGTTPTSGGYRLGIQGGLPVEGGTLRIASGSALGGLSQVQFNSGTLEIVGSAEAAVGLSVGGRTNSTVSIPAITGGALTLSGTSGYFNAAGGSDGDVLFNVNNVTTLTGAFNPTSFTSLTSIWVGVGGTGTLVLAGDASRLIDKYIVSGSVTLVIDGTLGGEQLFIEAGATVSGGGTFAGSSPWEDADGNPSNNLTQPASPIYVASTANVFGTLAPSGVLTIRASTTMQSSASVVLSIDGTTRGTQYSALSFEVPPDSGFAYSLGQNGAVTLDFGAPAVNGTYDLISTGTGVTRSGGFASVTLSGSHTGTLIKSGSVWSGASGDTSFSFDESSGVLTVTGGATATTPLEDWRLANFGTAENSGAAADGADFDGDGIANLIEYATGADPTTANASPITLATTASGEFLTLSFTRIDDPALSYVIEASDDLAAGFAPTGTSYTGGPAGTITHTDTVSLTTPGVRRFLRLVVGRGTAE